MALAGGPHAHTQAHTHAPWKLTSEPTGTSIFVFTTGPDRRRRSTHRRAHPPAAHQGAHGEPRRGRGHSGTQRMGKRHGALLRTPTQRTTNAGWHGARQQRQDEGCRLKHVLRSDSDLFEHTPCNGRDDKATRPTQQQQRLRSTAMGQRGHPSALARGGVGVWVGAGGKPQPTRDVLREQTFACCHHHHRHRRHHRRRCTTQRPARAPGTQRG
jgi:hypothetical protein